MTCGGGGAYRARVAEIDVSRTDDRAFTVRVRDGTTETTHRVTVPPRLAELELPDGELKHAVRESFAFLLEREPASAILGRFSLDEIERYFPAYPDELLRRLG